MSGRSPLSPETRALLDREREIPALPAAQRARALARARAALAAGGTVKNASSVSRARTRWLATAAAALIASAAVGAAAYELRARLARAPGSAQPRPVVADGTPAPAPTAAVAPIPEAPSAPELAPGVSAAEAARAELRLLREARAAVARGDFAAALVPLGEHARRFKNGRLTEEREALRVRSLAGLGRTEEARRAATAFRARFPRSVLLPAVRQMSTAP